MNILVFGGGGFLGSHVCDELTYLGHYVTIFDRIESPYLKNGQKMVVGNILDEELVSELTKNIDIVYNFAALADLNETLDKPLETIKINILGNTIILEACRRNNVKRFIYASTLYVYSQEGGFYRCSKQAAEQYVEEYYKKYNLNYTILRFGSLYGPRADQSNGLYKIIKGALENGYVKYEGSENALREYIHVEDAAKASAHAIDEIFRNQSVTLTGQQPMRVIDLLEMISEILNLKEPIKFINNTKNGHYVRTPYSYQPKLGIKYSPNLHVDLGQGLLQLIVEIKNNLNK